MGRPWTEENRRKHMETWQRKREEKAIQKALDEKRDPPPPPKVGGKGNHQAWKNGPFVTGLGESEEDKEMISRILAELRSSRRNDPVFSDEDLEARLDEYFKSCEQGGVIPTVEEMYLFVGYSRRWGHDIRTGKRSGFSPRTARILEQAHEVMAAFDAKLLLMTGPGRFNPTNYIFRSKNYYGMKDEQEVVVSAGIDDQKKISAEEIAKRYLDDGNTVETTFADEGGK